MRYMHWGASEIKKTCNLKESVYCYNFCISNLTYSYSVIILLDEVAHLTHHCRSHTQLIPFTSATDFTTHKCLIYYINWKFNMDYRFLCEFLTNISAYLKMSVPTANARQIIMYNRRKSLVIKELIIIVCKCPEVLKLPLINAVISWLPARLCTDLGSRV